MLDQQVYRQILKMNFRISDFTPADADRVNQLALSAFEQYQHDYADWLEFAERISNMAALAHSAELIVARMGDELAGAVAYVGPGKEKGAFFNTELPILRRLVVGQNYSNQ